MGMKNEVACIRCVGFEGVSSFRHFFVFGPLLLLPMDCIITSDSCSAQTRQAPQASDRRKTMENETELVGCLYVDGIVSTHEPPEDVAAHNNDETSVFPEHLIPSPWKRLRFVFHDFALIPYDCAVSVASGEIDCHGYTWKLQLYPGGFGRAHMGYVSSYLICGGMDADEEVHVQFCMRFGSDDRHLSITSGEGIPSPAVVYDRDNDCWGDHRVIKREHLLERHEKDPTRSLLCDDGSLWVDVDIQVGIPRPPSSKPANSIKADMAKVLDMACEENSDVVFQVGDRTFHCLSALLQVRAPELHDLISEYDKNTPIPISGVCPDTFQLLMLTVYGGEIPDDKKTFDALKALISAADRFGCTRSKHLAEHELVMSNSIGVDNVAELLLFADGANCALIKEAAISYFLSNSDDVRKTKGYAKLKESPHVLEELLFVAAEAHKKRPASPVPPERDYKRMRVSDLRSKLDGKGFDVDGSREILASRLEGVDAAEAATAAEAAAAENDDDNSAAGDEAIESE